MLEVGEVVVEEGVDIVGVAVGEDVDKLIGEAVGRVVGDAVGELVGKVVGVVGSQRMCLSRSRFK